MDQNQEVNNVIFDFALTNRNEMSTKLISSELHEVDIPELLIQQQK